MISGQLIEYPYVSKIVNIVIFWGTIRVVNVKLSTMVLLVEF